ELAQNLPMGGSSLERLRRTFAQRIDALPEAARLGLLLAAAESEPNTVLRAAEIQQLGDPLAPAEAAGLARVENGTIEFRHPVVRSLVYAGALEADRAAAHRALADALPDAED